MADHLIIVLARIVLAYDFRGSLIWRRSHPIAILPDEKNVGRDHPNHDKHPVLAFETQKSKMLNEKLHRPPPPFCAGKAF
ncbi:MAG TPA: hypothetical protein VKC60_03710 [Opitutaceae bacterium]|nr:hypothetical protein [Opitutaceae bacterium]